MKLLNSHSVVIIPIVLIVLGLGLLVHALHVPNPVQAEKLSCNTYTQDNGLSIAAESAYVVDLKTHTPLYVKNAHAQLPLASLTKLMTVLVASEILDEAQLITISEEAFNPEGDSGFVIDELWKAVDLIDFTLITSSNDGAHALALAVKKKDANENGRENFDFIKAMNAKASHLGMVQTYFINDTGLDVSLQTAGAYGSAYDVSLLLSHVYRESSRVFDASTTAGMVFRSVSGIEHTATHTSGLVGVLPGSAVSKTGFTDLAGGNLGVVVETLPGHPVAIVVLHSTREMRDKDVETLYQFSRDMLKRATLCNAAL